MLVLERNFGMVPEQLAMTSLVDSPESPEIMEMTENFNQILNQTKRNINKVCLGKISVKIFHGFLVFEYALWEKTITLK